jgi:hypothetical protein
MIIDMVMVYVHYRMDINMKVNGLKVKNMDVVWKYFQMDIDTMESFNMIKRLYLHQNKFIFLIKNNK